MMDRNALKSAGVAALSLVSACVFLITVIALNTHLVLFDFIHGNPHRTLDNVIATMIVMTPIMGALVTLVATVCFLTPVAAQTFVAWLLLPRCGRSAYLWTILSVPLTALLIGPIFYWLTDRFTDQPPVSLFTTEDYPKFLAGQILVAAVTLAYCDAATRQASKKRVILVALLGALALGMAQGYRMTEEQIDLLEHPRAPI
jgi:hypothetical protein